MRAADRRQWKRPGKGQGAAAVRKERLRGGRSRERPRRTVVGVATEEALGQPRGSRDRRGRCTMAADPSPWAKQQDGCALANAGNAGTADDAAGQLWGSPPWTSRRGCRGPTFRRGGGDGRRWTRQRARRGGQVGTVAAVDEAAGGHATVTVEAAGRPRGRRSGSGRRTAAGPFPLEGHVGVTTALGSWLPAPVSWSSTHTHDQFNPFAIAIVHFR